MMTVPTQLKPFIYFAAGWFVPGLGHLLQGRRTKAAVFFIGVSAMVGLGLIMKGGFASLKDLEPLSILSFIGGIGNGLLYFVGRLAGAGDPWSYTFQYGTAYIASAGFMNLLIALNAVTTAGEEVHV
jgi:hypothetical protein